MQVVVFCKFFCKNSRVKVSVPVRLHLLKGLSPARQVVQHHLNVSVCTQRNPEYIFLPGGVNGQAIPATAGSQ
jgi:hypothetical protein